MNKKIWLLFYIITAIATAAFFSAVYVKYNELIKKTKTEQIYVTKSFNAHLHDLFLQQELIHNLIAEQYQQANFNPHILDIVVKQNSSLYNMAIFSRDGKLLEGNGQFINNTNNNNNNKTNKTNKTNKWFSKAINNTAMVVGEAYFNQQANKWLIPLYKSIEGSNKSLNVMFISSLDITKLNQQLTEINNNNIQITLADGLTPIFRANLPLERHKQYYSQAFIVQSVDSTPYLGNGITPSETNTQRAMVNGVDSLFTVTLDQRYQLLVSADTKFSLITERLFQHSILYSIFYFSLIIIVWGLIKWAIKIEQANIIALTYEIDHDGLTGLPNRNILNRYYQKAKKNNAPFSLLYLDLDKFKSFNDSFGHSYGDLILIKVAERISKSIKSYNGTAIRYSGDEFLSLINSNDKELLQHCATHLLDTVSQPYFIDQVAFKITASIGIACYPEDADDIETLLSYADNSMYVAKQSNNQCSFFSKSAHYQLTRRVNIEQALHHAIERQEISLVYQPQLDANNALFGVEALVRWNSKNLGIVPPDEFISIAEEIGIMPKLGLFIMHRAMQEITELQQDIGQHFTLSINVSVRQFIQIDFIEKLVEVLTKYSSTRNQLTITIEITESLFIESLEALLPLFHKIKHNHITLSLDDFGTGYSSLSLLRDVPIDELKIDKSFVDHIATNTTDKAMVESIISMGKKLGLIVLAEGVESREQADILLAAGCDLFQGYLFSKPLSIDNLKAYCLQPARIKRSDSILPDLNSNDGSIIQ